MGESVTTRFYVDKDTIEEVKTQLQKIVGREVNITATNTVFVGLSLNKMEDIKKSNIISVRRFKDTIILSAFDSDAIVITCGTVVKFIGDSVIEITFVPNAVGDTPNCIASNITIRINNDKMNCCGNCGSIENWDKCQNTCKPSVMPKRCWNCNKRQNCFQDGHGNLCNGYDGRKLDWNGVEVD